MPFSDEEGQDVDKVNRLTDPEKHRKTRKHGLQKRAHTPTYVTDFAARVDEASRDFHFARSVSKNLCVCGVCQWSGLPLMRKVPAKPAEGENYVSFEISNQWISKRESELRPHRIETQNPRPLNLWGRGFVIYNTAVAGCRLSLSVGFIFAFRNVGVCGEIIPNVRLTYIRNYDTVISELSSSIMLYRANSQTLTVSIYTEVIRDCFGNAAAYSTVLTVTSVLSLLLFFKLTGRKDISV